MGASKMPQQESELHDKLDSGELEGFKYSAEHWPLKAFMEAWIRNQNLTEWSEFRNAMVKAFIEQRKDERIPPPSDWRLQQRLMVCSRNLRTNNEARFEPPKCPERKIEKPDTLAALGAELGLVAIPKKS